MRPGLVLALLWAGAAAASPVTQCAFDPDVLMIGEVHDNPDHHATQAALLAASDPSAIIFEMVTAAEAQRITPALAGDPEALEAVLDWENSGWPAFEMYAPLFAFATDVPIYGAEVPRARARLAMEQGAAAVFGPDAEWFGLDEPLAHGEQVAREALQQDAHCNALPPELLPGFVEAQRLRDAEIAVRVLSALEAHGPPVFVIAGNGHLRTDWGAPALLSRAAPELRVCAIAQIEWPFGEGGPFGLPYTEIEVTPVLNRPDPCAAFR